MKIFITGSEGFIGSHLTEHLVRKGHEVKCLVQYNFQNNNGWIDNFDKNIKKEIEIVNGDIRDEDLMQKLIGKKTEIIFNLAALIGIPYSYLAPRSYVETNIIGTLNILNAAKKLNHLASFVQTSSSEVYGTAKIVPIKEDHALEAQSPYAATKIGADQLAISFYRSFGIPVTILRPFNTYGPRQSARAIIPTIITQILKKNKFIKLGNLSPTRDFTYVEDTVESFIKIIKNKKAIGEIINIGSNFEISIKEILNILRNDLGYNFKTIKDTVRVRKESSEVFRLIADNTKAKKILNWKPRYSGTGGFKLGLKQTIHWFKEPRNLIFYNSNKYSI